MNIEDKKRYRSDSEQTNAANDHTNNECVEIGESDRQRNEQKGPTYICSRLFLYLCLVRMSIMVRAHLSKNCNPYAAAAKEQASQGIFS